MSGTPSRNVTFSESTNLNSPPEERRLLDDYKPPTFYKHSEGQEKEIIIDDDWATLGSSAQSEPENPTAPEWSNLLDASLGPAANSTSHFNFNENTSDMSQDDSISSLVVPKRNSPQLSSSRTLTPASNQKRQPRSRRSTTPVRSPSPLAPRLSVGTSDQDQSVYYSAPRDATTSFADESAMPDPASSPSHRPAQRKAITQTPPLRSEHQSIAADTSSSSVQQQTNEPFGKYSLSTIMDDSPVHESQRFSFTSPDRHPSLEDIPLDSPTPSPSKHSPPLQLEPLKPHCDPSPTLETVEEDTVTAKPSVTNLTTGEDLSDLSESNRDDRQLAEDLEALLATQSQLISDGQVQRTSLLALLRNMHSHIRSQSSQIKQLNREKEAADAGWRDAIEETERWEASLDRQRSRNIKNDEEYQQLLKTNADLEAQLAKLSDDASQTRHQLQESRQELEYVQERVEMQESEQRSQLAKSQKQEHDLRAKLQEDLETQQQEVSKNDLKCAKTGV